MQFKFLIAMMGLMLLMVLGANEVEADRLSGRFSGACFAWDNENCRQVCIGEGAVSGHCSASLKCWCE
ncbi:hypothetical protein KR018_011979 [Drosophila ironensis]|nr:hypothetical protein KR018_011979 [Drosophila ironensis]